MESYDLATNFCPALYSGDTFGSFGGMSCVSWASDASSWSRGALSPGCTPRSPHPPGSPPAASDVSPRAALALQRGRRESAAAGVGAAAGGAAGGGGGRGAAAPVGAAGAGAAAAAEYQYTRGQQSAAASERAGRQRNPSPPSAALTPTNDRGRRWQRHHFGLHDSVDSTHSTADLDWPHTAAAR